MPQIVASRLQLVSTFLGNLFEHYDTALFGLLSSFLAPMIFPDKEPITALIYTYAMIPLGMLARPLGALLFGYIGDSWGRSRALFFTLAGMAIVSLGMAFCPTYAQIGALSPLLFCIGRALQNLFSAGETMGGAIFLLENTPVKKHDLLSGLYNSSTIGGFLFASGGVTLLCTFHLVENGWRVLYVLGGLTVLFGALIRQRMPSVGKAAQKERLSEKLQDLLGTLWECKKPLVLIMLASGFSYACYIMALVLLNGFVPLVTTYSKVQMMSMNTLLLILDFCALPFFGWLASKFSREKIMLSAAFAVFIGLSPLLSLLSHGSLLTILFVRTTLVLLGVAFFAPFHAWAQEFIPTQQRYLIISFGYALGSQLLGGPDAVISLALFKKTQVLSSVGWYMQLLALGAISAVFFSIRLKKRIGEKAV